MEETSVNSSARIAARGERLVELVSAVGEEGFGYALARFLNKLCGAEQVAAFQLGNAQLKLIAAGRAPTGEPRWDRVNRYVSQGWWERDPSMHEAQEIRLTPEPVLIHADLWNRQHAGLRQIIYPDISDRLLLCGGAEAGSYQISILRAECRDQFDDAEVCRVRHFGAFLIAVLAKHVRLRAPGPNAADAIRNLAAIEQCINACGTLTLREAEVCSRIVYGLSASGIAADLAVSEETVKTYRKRAYRRLGIGSERELLTWYLHNWSSRSPAVLAQTPTPGPVFRRVPSRLLPNCA